MKSGLNGHFWVKKGRLKKHLGQGTRNKVISQDIRGLK
jgi:hypothetical protein